MPGAAFLLETYLTDKYICSELQKSINNAHQLTGDWLHWYITKDYCVAIKDCQVTEQYVLYGH